ncbi:dockerin type I domain-containing protein [Ruminococcus flavefaciens]|uniref:dockerin type I domain-containing protein n=1 Tax=Ruminococcus flavefaciens TaxID=1265 RepID=UPI000B0A81A8|nr:dockerin type I domain-containing protein [Ruminococcus flavefaciens]
MKASRILAALVSAVTLTNTAGMSAFAANNDKNATNGDYNYVALGDSIAAGFGLAGGNITEDPALVITDKLLADPVKGAYPAIFTEYLEKLGEEKGYNVKGTNLASTAYRAEDIEKTIKNEGYKGEFASTILEMYLGEGASDVLTPYHDYYNKYLSEADLVSIQLGGNDIIMSIVPQMVFSENPVLRAAGTSLMLTLFGMDTEIALGGGLQIINENKDSITSDDFIEAASFMYNVSAKADELVDDSASHVKGVVEAVKGINGDADIALVGMFNPYRTAEESETMEEDIFEVLGKIYAAAANAAAESEDELTASGKQTANYINNLNDKVDKITEIEDIMDKYNDSAELEDVLSMVEKYDDITEVQELSELVAVSKNAPAKEELMDVLLKYDDINELQSVIDLINNYDDLSELTDLMEVMSKNRTESQATAEKAIAAEIAAPMAMQAAGKNVDPQMRRLNEKLIEVAAQTGATYVDVYGISPEDDFDPHPNANGHKEIADILFNTMSETINKRMVVPEPVEEPAPEETLPAEEVSNYNFRVLGDVNGDDEVNTDDAMLIMSHVLGYIQLSDADLRYADINEDGEVDWYDSYVLMLFTSDYDPRYNWYNTNPYTMGYFYPTRPYGRMHSPYGRMHAPYGRVR